MTAPVLRHCGVKAEARYFPDGVGTYLCCPVCGLRTEEHHPSMEVPGPDWQMLEDLVTEWNEIVREQKVEEERR